jgi:hypothetical protein
MHRIAYTSEELKSLERRLRASFSYLSGGGGGTGTTERARIAEGIIRRIIEATYDTRLTVRHGWLDDWVAPPDLQYLKASDPETVYQIIQYQVTARKHPPMQHAYQVMYHTPYTHLPLLVGHKDKFIRTIVQWRLEAGK